jgi:hypothetical protein
MPVRNFRIYLSNHTEFELHRTAHVLCPALGGDSIWTSDDWKPPEVIPPRSERGWQAESDGIATGTEGYVKYRIAKPRNVIPGGPPPPMDLFDELYIYWVNPFANDPIFSDGPPTEAKGVIDPDGVGLDCDPQANPGGGASGGSTFGTPARQSEFELIPEAAQENHPDWAPGRPQDGSEGPIGPQVPIAFVMVFGSIGIVEHAWARFILRQRGSVRESLRLGYDPMQGIVAALPAGTTSLRAVLRL